MKTTIALVLLVGILGGCVNSPKPRMETLTVDQLTAIIVQEPDGEIFLAAVQELGHREQMAADAAPALARALAYPRHDSTEAAIALIKIGPAGVDAVPQLVNALKHERPEVRAYAALALGSIGTPAQCAVPELAQLLSDDQAQVRTAGAIAIAEITNLPLVDSWLMHRQPEDYRSVILDKPEGSISGKALVWWTEEGQIHQWNSEPNSCLQVETDH